MRKHAFVGFDQDGDACIYVQVLNDKEAPKGEPAAEAHERFLGEVEMGEIAERINQQEGWSE